jgi:hypothetical protein
MPKNNKTVSRPEVKPPPAPIPMLGPSTEDETATKPPVVFAGAQQIADERSSC